MTMNLSSYEGKVPPLILRALQHYAEHGYRTGDFLYAVFSNSLMDAVARADKDSLASLRYICEIIYNELPARCHGSPEVVEAWIKQHELKRAALEAAQENTP